jgi:hypothetical protein
MKYRICNPDFHGLLVLEKPSAVSYFSTINIE